MGRRLKIALASVAVALAGVIVWRMWPPSEPVYQDRTLTSWLKGCSTEQEPEADEAVRQVGTNAIPTLLRMLRMRDSVLKVKLMDLAQRLHTIKIEYTPAAELNHRARHAFGVLGGKAQSAAPALMEIAMQNISRDSQGCAIEALGVISPPVKDTIPLLSQWATNADYTVRYAAIGALGNLRAEPDRVVPVLMNALDDPNPRVQISALVALEHFGPEARLAVPILIQLLKEDEHYKGKPFAADALKAIDPEALEFPAESP